MIITVVIAAFRPRILKDWLLKEYSARLTSARLHPHVTEATSNTYPFKLMKDDFLTCLTKKESACDLLLLTDSNRAAITQCSIDSYSMCLNDVTAIDGWRGANAAAGLWILAGSMFAFNNREQISVCSCLSLSRMETL